jgi:hypothetical protein
MTRLTPLPLLLAAAVTLGVLAFAEPAAACPMCKESVENPDGTAGPEDPAMASGLPGGFNKSVYLMLGGLFGTMGLVGWVVVKGIRTPSVRPGGFPVSSASSPASTHQPPRE